MPEKYTEYKSYTGRQMEYIVVPHYYPHYFFEGIQSVAVTHNNDPYSHGQYGFNSDILVESNYTYTSGSISLKEFNNGMYALRGMTRMNPSTSFLFDPAYLDPVELVVNVLNEDRTKVLRSSWFVDFLPSVNEVENIEDISTKELDYKAARKIDFEGCQIVCQEWMETKEGDQDFQLFYPALIEVKDHLSMREQRATHELSPIPYLLRVMVGGEVLKDPNQAELITTANGSDVYSILHIRTPIGTPGTPVIVMWLADGSHRIGGYGFTTAPVMADVVPKGDWTIGGTGWDGTLEVYFSDVLRNVESLAIDSNNEYANFILRAVELDSFGNIITQGEACPSDIGGASNGQPAQFGAPGTLISRNKLVLSFIGSTGFSSLPSPIPVLAGDTLVWSLQYRAHAGLLPLQGEESESTTPAHILDIRTTIS